MILFAAATARELKHFCPGNEGFDFKTGLRQAAVYCGCRVGFLVCGVGPLNAALGLQRILLTDSGIELVINVGIAGSYDLEKDPLGTVCRAKAEIWPEYGIRTGDAHVDVHALGFPLLGRGRSALWNRMELDAEELSSFKDILHLETDASWNEAVALTVSGASGSVALAQRLAQGYRADMENMEGFALAYVCRMHKVPFVEIRSISNLAGSRNASDWNLEAAFTSLSRIWDRLWKRKKEMR